jgi:hypothetical protein
VIAAMPQGNAADLLVAVVACLSTFASAYSLLKVTQTFAAPVARYSVRSFDRRRWLRRPKSVARGDGSARGF